MNPWRCADLGITNEPREDHAAYLRSWPYVQKQDRKALITAGSKASAAADYLRTLSGRRRLIVRPGLRLQVSP